MCVCVWGGGGYIFYSFCFNIYNIDGTYMYMYMYETYHFVDQYIFYILTDQNQNVIIVPDSQ